MPTTRAPRPISDEALAAAVARALADAPPLTDRQVNRLSVLLNPTEAATRPAAA